MLENFNQHPAEILILLFLTATLLQSGVDKLVDRRGNVAFIKEHFKDSPLGGMVPLLVTIITIMELSASIMMGIGVFNILLKESTTVALAGIQIASLTLIFLLIGQRLAKDYAGAMTLAVYFIIAVFGVHLLS